MTPWSEIFERIIWLFKEMNYICVAKKAIGKRIIIHLEK